tara:strand:+ start:38 stop:304 length:267 start_codon:yes stop_codon:yes gene_type:complete
MKKIIRIGIVGLLLLLLFYVSLDAKEHTEEVFCVDEREVVAPKAIEHFYSDITDEYLFSIFVTEMEDGSLVILKLQLKNTDNNLLGLY